MGVAQTIPLSSGDAFKSLMLGVSAGWHAHLDILVDRVSGREPGPFWSTWSRLRAEYADRLA